MIPILETERLVLRPYRQNDFDAYCALWADREVVRFIGSQPFEREMSWSRFVRQAGMWQMLGFGYFAIEEKATGSFVGEAGFQEARRAMTPSLEGTLEAGWVLSPASHGQGYATEAMRAAIAWADACLNGQRMTCIIAPENTPSLRVASKLGFLEQARSLYRGNEMVVLERTCV